METQFGKYSAIQSNQPLFFSAIEAAREEMGNQETRLFQEGIWHSGDFSESQDPVADEREYHDELREDVGQSVASAFEAAIRGRFADIKKETGLTARELIGEIRDIAVQRVDSIAAQ